MSFADAVTLFFFLSTAYTRRYLKQSALLSAVPRQTF